MAVQIGAVLFSACTNLDGQCLVKGQFTNLSGGELYFYMPEGPREKIDTISVREGKFTYAIPDPKHSYSILLFPNMSEQVVFVEPDLEVKISANATELRNIKITGGEANKLMSEFRAATRDKSPEEVRKAALEFIQQHPTSVVCNYLFRKYLMYVEKPDLALIDQALEAMSQAQPQLLTLKNLQEDICALASLSPGNPAPDFTVVDYSGVEHKLEDYKDKSLLLVFGASWVNGHREQLRRMKNEFKGYENNPEVLNLVFESSKAVVRSYMLDSIPGALVHVKKSWQSEIVKDYQIKTLPTYLLIDKNQRIVAREEQWNDIKKHINK